jgi:pyridoxal phosphate enzyme (YggS family)
MNLQATYAGILKSLSSAGRPMTLIAVSKGQPIEKILALYEMGHRDFGENYVQELLQKESSLRPKCPELRWHFLGHLQSNKVKSVVPYLSCLHSLESLKQIEAIEKAWSALPACGKLSVFVAVKLSDEASKHGVLPEDLEPLLKRIAESDHLQAEGLMVIPKVGESEKAFERLSKLSEQHCKYLSGQLSMGMSDDYLLALPYGATHVRIGTALFGAREAKP